VRREYAQRFVHIEDQVVFHGRVFILLPVHDVGGRVFPLRHEPFVDSALADVLGGGIHPRVCGGAKRRNGMVHAGAFYGLNIFAVEVSVMIQTKNKMLYTTQRP
jgi:hypothetical protein